MATRKPLPHTPPSWIDPFREVWFITICCAKRGETPLTLPGVADALIESVRYRWELAHWHPHVFLLMPDHCHALLSFPPDRPIKKTILDWKHWTATKNGIVWQPNFFDHRLRRGENFAEKSAYISNNPVRTSLVTNAESWPHVWRAPEIFTSLNR